MMNQFADDLFTEGRLMRKGETRREREETGHTWQASGRHRHSTFNRPFVYFCAAQCRVQRVCADDTGRAGIE